MLSSAFSAKCKSRGPLTFIPLLLGIEAASLDVDEGGLLTLFILLAMSWMSSSSSSSSAHSIYTSVSIFFPS
ncbi:hypothetical protein Fmac_012516 [Flemingia macrophylla]|uniref:Uncharacterized protein n=1 Tax=Flemingia macrophylla TaxID=520843 RepID=A0ABD1MQH4_9FABA